MNDNFLDWKLNNQDDRVYCYLCYRDSSTDSLMGCLGSISTQPSPKDGLAFLEQAMANLRNYGLPKKIRDKLEEEIVNKAIYSDRESQQGPDRRKKRFVIPTAWSLLDGGAVGYCIHDES